MNGLRLNVWPKRKGTADRLVAALADFSANERPLPGISRPGAAETLAMQMVASLRRLDYTEKVRRRPISEHRADPSSPMFDPERAAMLHASAGQIDQQF
jgi:alpha-glutamyl/putrescinyl thymine pyrophosphorylase-like protein